MFVISTALLLSGIVSLLGDSEKITLVAVAVLIVGCPSRLQIQNILGAGHGARNASSEIR